MGEIYAAKTNHITNPVGYALKPLVFSWKVKGCKGQEQRRAVPVLFLVAFVLRFGRRFPIAAAHVHGAHDAYIQVGGIN